MPEIGDQLRETRMRSRIDITEVEAATKIRAKYLRALENEEWDLLPGPTFVKTFLRTYADYLGLDARNARRGVPPALRAPEPAGADAAAARTSSGRRGAPARASRSRRGCRSPWASCCSSARSTCSAPGATAARSPAPTRRAAATATPTATPTPEPRRRRPRGAHAGAAADRGERPGERLPRGGRRHAADRQRHARRRASAAERFRGKRFLASFGTGAAVMRVNGRPYEVSDDAPIGYEIRPGRRPRPVPESRRPTVRGLMAVARGHRRHRHRGARRASSPTATARGCPSGCASAACRWRTSSSPATGPADLRAALEFLAGRGRRARRHLGRPRPDGRRPHRRGRRRLRRPRAALRRRARGAHLGDRLRPAPDRRVRRGRRCARAAASRRWSRRAPTVLEPVGTAPGLVVPPRDGRRRRPCSCSPARPGSCRRCGSAPWRRRRCVGARAARAATSSGCCGSSASPSRRSPPRCASSRRTGLPLEPLEITTCLRRGELEIATVFAPGRRGGLRGVRGARCASATATALFSDDGSTVDDQVAELLAGRTVAVAESCTGGLMAARLTERAGSSAYVLGGARRLLQRGQDRRSPRVPPALIERHGAVSPEVAAALADGARARFGARVRDRHHRHRRARRGHAGEAGGHGLPERGRPGGREDRTVRLPGGRGHIRDRTTTIAMHMLRRLLAVSCVRPRRCRSQRRRRERPALRRARPPAGGARARSRASGTRRPTRRCGGRWATTRCTSRSPSSATGRRRTSRSAAAVLAALPAAAPPLRAGGRAAPPAAARAGALRGRRGPRGRAGGAAGARRATALAARRALRRPSADRSAPHATVARLRSGARAAARGDAARRSRSAFAARPR